MKNLMTAVAALTIFGIGYADAASRHQRHRTTAPSKLQTAPVALPQSRVDTSRPAWAPTGACFTDEGYGRFSPCSSNGR